MSRVKEADLFTLLFSILLVICSLQVIPSSSLPTLEDWMSCDLPLCPVIIDNRTAIEDSGEHMLQVCIPTLIISIFLTECHISLEVSVENKKLISLLCADPGFFKRDSLTVFCSFQSLHGIVPNTYIEQATYLPIFTYWLGKMSLRCPSKNITFVGFV